MTLPGPSGVMVNTNNIVHKHFINKLTDVNVSGQ